MKKQLHQRVDTDYVKHILGKHLSQGFPVEECIRSLKVSRSRFYELLSLYRANPEGFSIEYKRESKRRISVDIQRVIIDELKKDKELIDDIDIPINRYNYSYLRERISEEKGIEVSLPTIIKIAKENGFYIERRRQKVHDREVITSYVGELIQHDTSHHLFAPLSNTKWYLITSIDDYSRAILYAKLVERETSWAQIMAIKELVLKNGLPLRYYVDNHSIFRFVRGRDIVWVEKKKTTDEVVPQWRQVLTDLNIDVTYALSPQAKGKIERPFRWLQDHMIRTCVRKEVTGIKEAQDILDEEVERYNYKLIHTTTREVPMIRFKRAKEENKTMFREFRIRHPYTEMKDIFCLRYNRVVNGYRRVKFNNIEIGVSGVPVGERVEIRISIDEARRTGEMKVWYRMKVVGKKEVKVEDLGMSTFEV